MLSVTRSINAQEVGTRSQLLHYLQRPACCRYAVSKCLPGSCLDSILYQSFKTDHQCCWKMITEALSISCWGAGLVNMDIGSDNWLAQHNLKIPAHASNRTIPSRKFLSLSTYFP
eukprot:1158275-Pelagomonas_calceolata.AAC.1